MWRVPIPTCPAVIAYETCARNVRDIDFKERLDRAAREVDDADQLYRAAGSAGRFADLSASSFGLSDLTAQEMSGLYDRRMAAMRSPGRTIYDSLRSAVGKCPLCGHRDVMTLDHYLPKTSFPALAVNPVNLIPACTDCNKAKSNAVVSTMHPYYDNIEDVPWLQAEVLTRTPAAVRFQVSPAGNWPRALSERVNVHFQVFGLAALYSAQAARVLSGIRGRLQDLSSQGGSSAVREHLSEEARSWRDFSLNSWEAALYDSLAKSDWFCGGGFRF